MFAENDVMRFSSSAFTIVTSKLSVDVLPAASITVKVNVLVVP